MTLADSASLNLGGFIVEHRSASPLNANADRYEPVRISPRAGFYMASGRRIIRSPRRRAAVSMGVSQDRAPWRFCGSRDHLVFHRKLHGKIARLVAAQDAIYISGGATKGVH